MESVFSSETCFRTAYRRKLKETLVAETGLAAFILACANAYFDSEILADLSAPLQNSFTRLRSHYAALFVDGQLVEERLAEDLLVFLKMALAGMENLKVAETRSLGRWQLQFNHLRSFRPQRAAARPVASLHQPFNEHQFYYDPGLCERENFWSGSLEGKNASLLYNKYPFARLHALLIPEPERRRPQYLERDMHGWAWRVTERLGESLPGFGIGYNAIGTFASVNHLHLQTFIEPHGMPVTWDCWGHNGGPEQYPLACQVFSSAQDAWEWIDSMHQVDRNSYNLLYTPGKVYAFERRRQGTYRHARWTSGFAWYEVSGGAITFCREDFNTLTAEMLMKEYNKLHP
jgi:hypothetical protein